MSRLKEQLLEACNQFVARRTKTVSEIITSYQKALASETKSSAGDKHETGRAMLQLEMEKAGQQLASINQMKMVLAKLTIQSSEVVRLGSLVVTDSAHYFLAISAGEIKIDGKSYYAVSANSPIGKLLLGKQVGDIVNFTKEMLIKAIF